MPFPIRNLYSRTYYKSMIGGVLFKKHFRNIHTYCMFIGYPRSGHSLIGALIDAHPNAIIGMERDTLGLIEMKYKKNQIIYLIIKNSIQFSKEQNNCWTGYSYKIPGGYQGEYTDLLVIGDKKGGKSTERIGNNPSLLSKFFSVIKYPVKILHIVRNPFDIISTMYKRNLAEGVELDRDLLKFKIDMFFRKAEINRQLLEDPELNILTVYHESLIKNPQKELSRIFLFLGLKEEKEYLKECISIIYKEPHLSRHEIFWPENLKQQVYKKLKNYSFLKEYEF